MKQLLEIKQYSYNIFIVSIWFDFDAVFNKNDIQYSSVISLTTIVPLFEQKNT